MQYYQTDHSSGARLIGGEMLTWSDRESVGDLGVITEFLTGLRLERPARVLLAGPRAALLVERLDRGPYRDSDVDVVVRGLPDARELSAEANLRESVTIWCGGLERLTEPGPYDVVVLLDGPERVLTPDSRGMTHAQLIDLVSGWLTESGVLVAQVANGMGITGLLELPAEPRDAVVEVDSYDPLAPPGAGAELNPVRDRFADENANDRWWDGATGFAARAPYRVELERVLADCGLHTEQLANVFPGTDHPALLVADAALADDVVREVARALAVNAQAELFSSTPALMDPGTSVDRIFGAGLASALAPGWLVVASRGTPRAADPIPTLLVGEQHGAPSWRTAWQILDAGHGPVLTPVTARETREGRLERVPRPQPVAVGPSVETLLRDALASGNHGRIRGVVRRYATFLAGLAEGEDARLLSATADNVTATDGGLEVTDGSWHWHGRVDAGTVLARGLRRAAMRALRGGLPHPWRTDIAPDELAATMMIMAGVDEPEPLVARAAELEAEWYCLVNEISGTQREEVVAAQLAAGESQFTAMAAPARGYRESTRKASRMATELEVRQGQVMWLESALRTRERRMGSVERNLEDVRASMSFKVGRFVTWPGRRVAMSAKRGVLRMLPHDLMEKAERAARKLLK